MDPLLALLPSPLLGPAVWRSVADALATRGWSVTTAPPQRAPRSPADVLQAFLAAIPLDREMILIPHSNAGLYVPALGAERHVVGYVFVDAGLPARAGRVPLAPPEFRDVLAQMADEDGLLPTWTRWWGEADVADLFPSEEVRHRVEREQQRVPLSYFAESLPVPEGWDAKPGAYLAFGDTYAADRDEAARRGWMVTTLPAGHLHMVVNPGKSPPRSAPSSPGSTSGSTTSSSRWCPPTPNRSRRVIGREDVCSASGSACRALTWRARRVGGLGPGLTSDSADAARAVLRNDLSAGPQVLAPPALPV